jgi:hypothetical protein
MSILAITAYFIAVIALYYFLLAVNPASGLAIVQVMPVN